MMLTSTGEMRHRVMVHAPSDTVTKGSIAEGYGAGTARWARIEPMRSDEIVQADSQMGRLFYKVNMRWFKGLTTQHKLVWTAQTATLNIAGPPKNVGGLNREHELMCVESD